MYKFIIGALLLCLSSFSTAQGFYIDLAIGYHDADFDSCENNTVCNGTGFKGDWLGKVALGVELNPIYLEVEHISDVENRDRGLNTLWLGVRKYF